MIRSMRMLAVVAALTLCLAASADTTPKTYPGALVITALAGAPDNPGLFVSAMVADKSKGPVHVGDAITGKSTFDGKCTGVQTFTESTSAQHYIIYAQSSSAWARVDLTAVTVGGKLFYTIGAKISSTKPTTGGVQQPVVSGSVLNAPPKTATPTQQPGVTK